MNGSTEEIAHRIISVLQETRDNFTTVRKVANQCGFDSVRNASFKAAFNYLVQNKIIKLHQSGWTSEHGRSNHVDGVILISDLYSFDQNTLPNENTFCPKDETISSSTSIQSTLNEKHVQLCIECKNYEPDEPFGTCLLKGWGIAQNLAEIQRLCQYDQ